MDEVFVYLVHLPDGVDELVVPCADGYTVYLADRLDSFALRRKYDHAVRHIEREDWKKEHVNAIEGDAHGHH